MFARMGDVALDVLEIKLLSQVNGEISPKGLVPVLGLPLFDVCQMLVRLAREGIVASPAGNLAAAGAISVEESMQEAFAALDANDDEQARASALDSVLGSDDAPPAGRSAPRVDRHAATSVFDRMFGGGGRKDEPADDKAGRGVDQDFLSILKRSRKDGK